MRFFGKILQGTKGTVQDQVLSGCIYQYWSEHRINWGEDVVLGALVSGYPDGTSVKLKLFEFDAEADDADDPVKEIEGSLDKGLVKADWTVDFKDPDGEANEYEFYFIVEINGEDLEPPHDRPLLFVDLLPPLFSE